jgi:hypothetical protein
MRRPRKVKRGSAACFDQCDARLDKCESLLSGVAFRCADQLTFTRQRICHNKGTAFVNNIHCIPYTYTLWLHTQRTDRDRIIGESAGEQPVRRVHELRVVLALVYRFLCRRSFRRHSSRGRAFTSGEADRNLQATRMRIKEECTRCAMVFSSRKQVCGEVGRNL